MKILFLDDCPKRCAIFTLRFPEAVIVHTAGDCIECLKREAWDEVHLDHDLGGTQMQNSDREDSGMEVIRFIEYVYYMGDDGSDNDCSVDVGKFIIHSWNHVAAPIMAMTLRRMEYEVEQRPFRMMH